MASAIDSMMPSMPGSFHFQHGRTYASSNSQHVFRPPVQSPTPSRRTSHNSRPVSRSSNSQSCRKRPRLDTNTSYFSRPARPSPSTSNKSNLATPFSLDGSYDHITYNSNLESSTYSFDGQSIASPSPLANSEYRLAGGLDTPNASLERGLDEIAQDELEQDYRFNRYTSTANTSRSNFSIADSSEALRSHEIVGSDLINNSVIQRKRARSPTADATSATRWGLRRAAWALTGGLAGKVFNFCISTAFRGFSAGGGATYQIYTSLSDGRTTSLSKGTHGSKLQHSNEYSHDFGGFVEDFMNSPQSRQKGSHYQSTPSTLRNDWQIIDGVNEADSSEERSPARKRSRASVAGDWQGPAVARTSTAGIAHPRDSASYASPRARLSVGTQPNHHQRSVSTNDNPFPTLRRNRPSMNNHRHSHSSSYLPANTTFALPQSSASYANSGRSSPSRPSSAASARQQSSNLSPEVQSYKRKMKARERFQDDNLRRLNAQLRDMIREGKEALGSKIEVFDEGGGHEVAEALEDEGFYEDGWREPDRGPAMRHY